MFIKKNIKIVKIQIQNCECCNNRIKMINRPKSTTRKSMASNATSKNKINSKKQPSDTVYLMQNQNQILKLKNQQLSYKLDSLNCELRQRTQRVSDAERQCQKLREKINGSIFVQDIELQNHKKILTDKIALGNQNIQIYKNKIQNARKQVVLQEEKIPQLMLDRQRYEQQLRIIKMENQGSKKTLINLQSQNQEIRQRNNELSMKKYSKQPEQRAISEQIEQRIRLIKNTNSTQRRFKKEKTSKLIADILQNILFEKKKVTFLTIQRQGLRKTIIKKKIFLLARIRKNYLNFLKNKIISIFRQPLKPLVEEEKCVRILQQMRKRRQRAKMWRIWRNETAKAEYSLIRKYQSQNTIQKICQIITKSVTISSFNELKYFRNNYRTQIIVSKIYNTISKALNKSLRFFFYFLKEGQRSYEIEQQIQNSAEDQSKLLMLSRMFFGWVDLMKQKTKQSLTLKFKYFKRLKKIFTIRKRNILNGMLGQSKIKINDINIKSICFSALKKQLYAAKEKTTINNHLKVFQTLKDLKEDTQTRQKFDIQHDQQKSFMIIGKYLQRKAKEALNLWRRQNQRIYSVQKICSIISFNLQKSVNHAFSRIQIRRFERLKLSIRDKIQGCDYSYNYLVQENKHIKSVLDKKSYELEKAKFMGILQRLIRKQKEIKHKYFYKFLRNGYKCWKVKKQLEKIDSIMNKRTKIVFMFLLKFNKTQKLQQQKVQSWTARYQQRQTTLLLKNSFQAFKKRAERNKRIKRALSGIFDRNLQLNFYQAFGKMRNQSYSFQINQLVQAQDLIHSSIDQTHQDIKSTEEMIQVLNERLKCKQKTFRDRKTIAIYKFFLKNIKSKVGSYIWKWNNKVKKQKRIMKFVDILDSKTKSMVKMKFLIGLQKAKQQLQKKQLEIKLERYKTQYQNADQNFQNFIASSQEKINNMKEEDQQNKNIIEENEKKINHMNDVRVESFLKYWKKNIRKFVFRQWKNYKNRILEKCNIMCELLRINALRDAFHSLSEQIKFELARDKIKENISRITTKTYRHNLGSLFKSWRNTNFLYKVKYYEKNLKQAMKDMQEIQKRYETIKTKYFEEIDQRIRAWRLRRLTNAWRIITQHKIKNNLKKKLLEKWLMVGYSSSIIKVFQRFRIQTSVTAKKILDFQTKITQKKAKIFLNFIHKIRKDKQTIKRLFVNKFCFHQIYQLKENFLTRIKNYYHENEVNRKDRRTFCIQKIITTFQKKRKDILCQNMRIWKRNMYLINIQRNFLKRIVKKAMNNRVKDLFYAWKLQTEARFMISQQTQEGDVKKRKVEIKRLKKYLDQYKKQKGLLLENEEGNYVVSPRFQQNKEKQVKRQNILKYKFISRLILSMNGYQAPIKSWNNLVFFTKLRTQSQRCALLVKNRIQKGDLYTTFKIWHNGVKQLRKTFDEMERKDLIRLLNKQKDLMEIQYSKKVEIQQKIQQELRRYKVLSYQDKRKQKICAQILFREAKKVKFSAFSVWRKRVEEMKDYEQKQLEERGNYKLLQIQQQVQDLEKRQRQLQQNNRMLREAVQEALQLAEMIKNISEERDQLKRELSESHISCQNLQQQNQELNNKLILAQRQAMNLLTLSNKGI